MRLVNIANNFRTLYLFERDIDGVLITHEIKDFFPYFYEKDPVGQFKAYTGESLRKVLVSNPCDVPKQRTLNACEADILFVKRYLIDKVDKIEKTMIKYAFIDIEVLANEMPNVEEAKFPISLITVYNSERKTLMTFRLDKYASEYEMINAFICFMKEEKFDLWLSWNVQFDYNYLYNRYPDFAKELSIIGQTRYGDGQVFYPAGISIIDYLCVDQNTEILTEDGWKKYKEIKDIKNAITYNINSQQLEIMPIKEKYIYNFNGKMRYLKNKRTDRLITPNHRELYQTADGKGKPLNIKFDIPDNLPSQCYLFNYSKNGFDGITCKLSNEELKLLAWIITEGNIMMCNGKFEGIKITQCNQYIEEIENILKYLNIKYKKYNYEYKKYTQTQFYLSNKKSQIKNYFDIIGINKLLPRYILNADKNQLNILLKEMIKGDGHIRKNGFIYYEENNERANQFQELAFKCGYNTNLSKSNKDNNYIIIGSKQRLRYYPKLAKYEKIQYKGKVWCISTDNGTVVCRRNGKVFITGNSWFKKITLNREKQYTLDYIAQKHLNDEANKKVDFNQISDDLIKKNQNDVRRLEKLERKFHLIDYFDAIRRLSKVEWEDMLFNSRVLDMLLLQEAKNQNIILPMKPAEERGTLLEKEDYEGAFREVFREGHLKDVGVYDLSSCYPTMISDFCLDPANILLTAPLTAEKDYTPIKINETYFKQNSKALLPTVVNKLTTLKVDIKKKLSTLSHESEEYKDTKKMYDAIKSVVNSAYGVFGNRFFRLYNKNVASATTFLARDVLKYTIDKLKEKGYEVVYVDTDGIMINNNTEDISSLLNEIVQEWGKKFGKDKVNVEFEYQGYFKSLILLTKCRYDAIKDNGERETKGVESKRKDCFDGKTLILTDSGWKYFKNLTYEDKVLSMNPETNISHYYPIKNIIKEDYEGKMFTYSDQSIDFCVTPNHKFLQRTYQSPHTDRNKFKTITEIKNSNTNFTSQKYYEWNGQHLGNYFILSGIVNRQYKEIQFPIDAWFQFMGWYLSEGCVYINEKKKIYEIFIGQSNKNSQKKKLIKELLKDLSVYFYENERGFQIKNKLIAYELKKYGNNAKNKIIPNYIKKAFPHTIEHFLYTYCLGDGWYKGKTKQRIFSTSSKQMALDLQELITKIGKSATILERKIEFKKKWIVNHWANIGGIHYQISESSNKYFKINPKKIKTKKYKGKIYCVDIEPYHTIFVMRNGKAYWSGNSTKFMVKFQEELFNKIHNDTPKEEIFKWIKLQQKDIKNAPLQDIAFPCRLAKDPVNYKNKPIFVRALENTPEFSVKIGESFYYIYVKPQEESDTKTIIKIKNDFEKDGISYQDIVLDKNLTRKEGLEYAKKQYNKEFDSKEVSVLHRKDKPKDVIAFSDEVFDHVHRGLVDWSLIIQRNILMKLDTIFESLNWDVKEVL